MRLRLVAGLALLGAALAAPPPPLNYDDVVMFNNEGGYSVIKEAEFQQMIKRGEVAPPPRTPVTPVAPDPAPSRGGKTRRADCEKSTEAQVLSDARFLGQDVPMSPVVAAVAASATANVMQGYQIANQLGVGSMVSLTLVKDVVSVALEVSYSRQWASSQQITFLFQVPAGNYGIVVSEPWTRRVKGVVLTGCTDDPEKYPFTSDSYTSKSYGMLDWVDGVIRLCMSPTYPIPFCLGEGHHT